MEQKTIWHGRRAESVYDSVRIPGIIVTGRGSLIAYAEARDCANILGHGGDWAAIDLVMKRSTDRGETWSDTKILCRGANLPEPGGLKTANNPVMISDGDAIHLLYCLWYGLERICGGVYYMKSSDDGVTWSQPRNISGFCRTPEFPRTLIATGPGHGIVLSPKSKNPGMLLVPVWMTPAGAENDMNHRPSAVSTLCSLDHGETWRLGKVIRASEKMPNPSETAAVELSDGKILLNMRNEGASRRRAVTVSETGYDNWSLPYLDDTLVDPVCFGSAVRYDDDTLLFVNCADDSSRINLTVRASRSNGAAWEASRIIAEKAGYSDIAAGADGNIYVLYETDAGNTSVNLIRFSLDEIYNPEYRQILPG